MEKKTYKEKFEPITFPKDESRHNHIVEWWYFNGNLKTKKEKKEVSYMDCLFCVKPKKIDIPLIKNVPIKNLFFSHYLISDEKKFKHKTNPLCLVDKNNFTKPNLWINYDNSCLIEKRDNNRYHIVNDFIDLDLFQTKRPLLINTNGFMDLGSKTTYYYSLTRLDTKGFVKMEKEWKEVEGISWMDHQWAQTPLTEEDQWTWFSIQLDDGTDIICFEYGNKIRTLHASVMDKDQKSYHYSDISIVPKEKKYHSKVTKKDYSLEYIITIPGLGIELETSPIRSEQEMVFGSINYWEGPIRLVGKMKGKKIRGKGFMELLPNTKNKSIMNSVIQEVRKKPFKENLKEITSISTKSIYLLGEELSNK
jgi:predicted secreted hydrolase